VVITRVKELLKMNGRHDAPGSGESASSIDAARNEAEPSAASLVDPALDTPVRDGLNIGSVNAGAEPHLSMPDFQDLGFEWRFRPPVEKPIEIADAFTALLASEQGEISVADVAPDQRAAMESFINQVTSRVAERLTAAVVHERTTSVVHELAERLIRDELARVRTAATARR